MSMEGPSFNTLVETRKGVVYQNDDALIRANSQSSSSSSHKKSSQSRQSQPNRMKSPAKSPKNMKFSPIDDGNESLNGAVSIKSTKSKTFQLKEKIQAINIQLQKLKKERLSTNDDVKAKYTRRLPNYHPYQETKKKHYQNELIYKRTRLCHPKLEYVLAEVSLSPYLINPGDSYPVTILKNYDKVRELRAQGVKVQDIPKEELPFDVDEVKDTFVENIMKAQEFVKYDEFIRHSTSKVHESRGHRRHVQMSLSYPSTSGEDSSWMNRDGEDKPSRSSISESKSQKPQRLRDQILEARVNSLHNEETNILVNNLFDQATTVEHSPVTATEEIPQAAASPTNKENDEICSENVIDSNISIDHQTREESRRVEGEIEAKTEDHQIRHTESNKSMSSVIVDEVLNSTVSTGANTDLERKSDHSPISEPVQSEAEINTNRYSSFKTDIKESNYDSSDEYSEDTMSISAHKREASDSKDRIENNLASGNASMQDDYESDFSDDDNRSESSSEQYYDDFSTQSETSMNRKRRESQGFKSKTHQTQIIQNTKNITKAIEKPPIDKNTIVQKTSNSEMNTSKQFVSTTSTIDPDLSYSGDSLFIHDSRSDSPILPKDEYPHSLSLSDDKSTSLNFSQNISFSLSPDGMSGSDNFTSPYLDKKKEDKNEITSPESMLDQSNSDLVTVATTVWNHARNIRLINSQNDSTMSNITNVEEFSGSSGCVISRAPSSF